MPQDDSQFHDNDRDIDFVNMALLLNAEAFAARRFHVAYLALAAAHRAANDSGAPLCLDRVAARAREQQAMIDETHTAHWVAPENLPRKATNGALDMIIQQAELQARLLRAKLGRS